MIKNIVVISDTHCGCQFGLCPPKIKLDGGGSYEQSNLQKIVWNRWKKFWNEFVPEVTNDEDYIIVHNGDAIDGIHHGSTTQISHNITDQKNIYTEIFSQLLSASHCKQYFHIRGTEAHVGKSGEHEENIAKILGAKPDEAGNYARWELWLRFAGGLGHFTHHVGTTSSTAYESTAVHKELVEAYNEAGRWKDSPPDFIIRSHRHRAYEIKIPSDKGFAHAIVTPGWQLKTPFVYRGTLGRTGTPQIGGIIIQHREDIPIYTMAKIWRMDRSKEEAI